MILVGMRTPRTLHHSTNSATGTAEGEGFGVASFLESTASHLVLFSFAFRGQLSQLNDWVNDLHCTSVVADINE